MIEKKLLLSLFALTLMQPVISMSRDKTQDQSSPRLRPTSRQAELNAYLLGVRLDVVDLAYIKDLLTDGAQVDARDEAGKTALMKFAYHSFWPECRLLIIHSRFYPKEELIKLAALSTEQKEETAITLIKEKMGKLTSLMQEARNLAPDNDIKALLDPEKLGENFQTEIRENIREELGLKDSSWLAWLSDQ